VKGSAISPFEIAPESVTLKPPSALGTQHSALGTTPVLIDRTAKALPVTQSTKTSGNGPKPNTGAPGKKKFARTFIKISRGDRPAQSTFIREHPLD